MTSVCKHNIQVATGSSDVSWDHLDTVTDVTKAISGCFARVANLSKEIM